MSSDDFDAVLSSLTEIQDSSRTLKQLIEVRKKVDGSAVKNKETLTKLREKGTFGGIIQTLQSSKTKLINVSLSILGNCCLDAKCSREMVSQYGLLSSLNHVLKRFPKDDSINGRVFRIVGNLCQHQWATVILDKKPQIVIQIVSFLKAEPSEATVIMGLRALRELLNRETLERLVGTYGVLKTVGLLLIQFGEQWQEKKEIVMGIVKLLYAYSRYRHYPMLLELRNTPKGDSIVYLSKILHICPGQIVKIVMNFLRISQLKSDLPIPEIFDSFTEVLRDDAMVTEFSSTSEECIRCLCRLFEHPGNRENARCGDSIPLLIGIFKKLTFESSRKIDCSVLIISTLNRCRYSSNLISEQLKHNSIDALKEKLKLIVDVQPINCNHKTTARKRRNLGEDKSENKRKAFASRRLVLDDVSDSESSDDVEAVTSASFDFDSSPLPSPESELAMSYTSGLSPRSSPRSQIFNFSESDSDDYSPVCSEADATDFPEDDVFSIPDPETKSDGIPEETEHVPSFEDDADTLSRLVQMQPIIRETVDLFKTYVRIKSAAVQLGQPDLLMTLIKASSFFDWPRSATIVDIFDVIYHVLRCHDNLLPLMKSDCIAAIYDLSQVQGGWCSRCRQIQLISRFCIKKLSKLAESGGGRGDIAHTLLRADVVAKQQVVLGIPYIIRNKTILLKFMLNCGGLEVLIGLLKETSNCQSRSIKVLCVLASKKLAIPNPKNVETQAAVVTATQRRDHASSPNVTFRLDDGSLLRANRQLLSNSSDFFAGLLSGGFMEAEQDVIKLPNVNNKALAYLFELVKYDVDRGDVMDVDLDLATHLDVIGLCDRFLLEQYRAFLTDHVEKFRLSWETVPTIYSWSMESKTNLLRVECIAFALVGNIVDSDRLKMFRNLFDLGYTDELLEDIRQLLGRYMTLSGFSE